MEVLLYLLNYKLYKCGFQTKHIINYDFPTYIADYIHRCGRTGRLNAGTDGKVTNYISTNNDSELVQKIEVIFTVVN